MLSGKQLSTKRTVKEVKNATVKQKGIQYRITKKAKGKNAGEVTLIKASNKNSITVPATIKINKHTYKVTTIGSNAFVNCKATKKLVIGKNVKKIGAKAFSGCKKLKNLTIKSTYLTGKRIGKSAFANIPKKAKVSVPKTKKYVYKKILKKKGLKANIK